MKNKRIFLSIIFAVISGLTVVSIMNFLHKGNINIVSLIFSVPIKIYLVAFLIFFSSYFLEAFRMMYLLWHRGYKVSYFSLLYNNILGYFFSYLTPFAMGGQPFQIYHLVKKGVDSSYATGIMVARVLQNSLGGAIIAIIMLNTSMGWIMDKGKLVLLGIAISLISSFILILSMVVPEVMIPIVRGMSKILRKTNWVTRFENWVSNFKSSLEYMWKENTYIMIVDILGWFFIVMLQLFSLFYILKGISSLKINFWFLFGSINAVNAIAYFIPTPGSSGGIEATYQYVLSSIVGNSEISLIAITGWRFIAYYLQLVLGTFMLWINNKHVEE
ncbi:hypothetical protein XJ44_00535 [Thermosipho affectus]|uniref:Uncharacterized protein n=1 Tax=Thermosipho affectus TaxID=660294 RepID=A0ABX3IJQ2_9BACT|nr:lysylphosphatidylglycerol synthase transmembrane domain-containing protein [Thermosipho affectus]ONN28065.1 hypothetical protein XJ44_00535 [Thermosipho affectus]